VLGVISGVKRSPLNALHSVHFDSKENRGDSYFCKKITFLRRPNRPDEAAWANSTERRKWYLDIAIAGQIRIIEIEM
jgi:hypothetical protein